MFRLERWNDSTPMARAGSPRLVTHVDNRFLRQLTALYAERIPPGGAVLDLMSSHVSHLPRDVKYSNVVGHGMNAVEVGHILHFSSCYGCWVCWVVYNCNPFVNAATWDMFTHVRCHVAGFVGSRIDCVTMWPI
jgi:hypothetical protein